MAVESRKIHRRFQPRRCLYHLARTRFSRKHPQTASARRSQRIEERNAVGGQHALLQSKAKGDEDRIQACPSLRLLK